MASWRLGFTTVLTQIVIFSILLLVACGIWHRLPVAADDPRLSVLSTESSQVAPASLLDCTEGICVDVRHGQLLAYF